MIRIPLRPLARIISARRLGKNPDDIEQKNLADRRRQSERAIEGASQRRLVMLGLGFACGFGLIGLQMGNLALAKVEEPLARVSAARILANRADVLDRNGRVLATNMDTFSLYTHPDRLIDPEATALALAHIFPDMDAEKLLARFQGGQKFIWLRKSLSPEEKQAVHDLGEPGLEFGPREMRLYPNGALAAHVLGGASFGDESQNAAEVIGVAGVEKAYDTFLRDPQYQGRPLQLSLDLTIQAVTEEVLFGGMNVMSAKGASAVIMEADTGEIVAMASLPEFDPNNRPVPLVTGDQGDSPLFNRAVQGVYELGSVFKPFSVVQAMELGLINADTMIDTRGPLKWGRFKIRDFHDYGRQLSAEQVIVKSSNIGTARIAMMVGGDRQRTFLEKLGFLNHTDIELIEGPTGRPLLPPNWSEISTMTISYGHGLSSSPIHLAAGYAAIANGGYAVKPTLLHQQNREQGAQLISTENAAAMRRMLRMVVTEGTAKMGNVPGYAVAGKTGTADKPRPQGGYYEDKVIATFAGMFPAHDPKYVFVITLDEPQVHTYGEDRRSAGWTAVPVTAELIKRIAPLLGVAPSVENDI